MLKDLNVTISLGGILVFAFTPLTQSVAQHARAIFFIAIVADATRYIVALTPKLILESASSSCTSCLAGKIAASTGDWRMRLYLCSP
mmetsp:Transcript_53232/g.140846  ORF Transcript_53232/g.140846 Transcript_53232/m.140846 type:complete len:87 (+) Transcript_53232:745-1005(+)